MNIRLEVREPLNFQHLGENIRKTSLKLKFLFFLKKILFLYLPRFSQNTGTLRKWQEYRNFSLSQKNSISGEIKLPQKNYYLNSYKFILRETLIVYFFQTYKLVKSYFQRKKMSRKSWKSFVTFREKATRIKFHENSRIQMSLEFKVVKCWTNPSKNVLNCTKILQFITINRKKCKQMWEMESPK